MLGTVHPRRRVFVRNLAYIIVTGLSLSLIAGCSGPIIIDIGDVAARLTDAVGSIQTQPQTLPPVLVQEGDTIIIDDRATIIEDPYQDIVVADLPDRTVLGFENDTGWDIYIKYFADGELQAVYVYAGEALLLGYPCLGVIELISEDDVDPDTGLLVESFDLTGLDYHNPDDFACGDAFILTFDPVSVSVHTEIIDLLL